MKPIKIQKILRYICMSCVVVLGFITIIGTGGGGSGGGSTGSAPTLSAVNFSPSSAEAGTTVTIQGSVTFSDPDGDLDSGEFNYTYENNTYTISLPGSLTGMKSGTINFELVADLSSNIGNISIPCWLVDKAGHKSNTVTVIFTQTPKIEVLAYSHYPSNLVVKGSNLFWTEISEGPIKKMPVTGGTPLALTRYVGVPVGMNIQGGDMYWIDYRPGGNTSCIPGETQVLNKSSLDGSVTEKLATGEHCAHEKANIVVDNENAYWVTSTVSPNEYSIQKIPLDGSPPTTITTTTMQPIDTMVRGATYLYWVEGRFPDPGVIKRIPLAGGAITEIYTVANGVTGNLTIEGSDLIVAEIVYPYPNNYRLLKIPAGGGSSTVLATLAQYPVPLKITTDATTIYWFDGTGVFSMLISGGSVTQLASIGDTAFDIVVDATSVIWLENDGFAGSLYEVPTGGGTPSVLATDLFTPYGGALTFSTNKIYFTEGDYNITWNGRIAEIPRTGGAVTSFITGVTASSNPMVTDGTSVYVVDGWRILKIPIDGGHAETLTRSGFYIEDLATDGSYVYWVEAGLGAIRRIHVTGGSIDPLTYASGFVERLEVDNTYLYWVEGLNTIKKIPIGGGSVTTVASGLAAVSDFISDGNYVYYSEQDAGRIGRVSVDGGSTETLTFQPINFSWITLTIDASNVYWIDQLLVGKVPKTGGSANLIVPGGMQQDATQPGSIAVDATHVYWTETDGGTIKRAAK